MEDFKKTQDLHDSSERILARQVARELTDREIDEVSGGLMRQAGTSFSGPCCCADDCCAV
jgi:hypothetical protein